MSKEKQNENKKPVKRDKISFKEFIRTIDKTLQKSFNVWINNIWLKEDEKNVISARSVNEWKKLFEKFKNYIPK